MLLWFGERSRIQEVGAEVVEDLGPERCDLIGGKTRVSNSVVLILLIAGIAVSNVWNHLFRRPGDLQR